MVQFRELGGSSGSAPPIPLFYSGEEGFCLKEIGLAGGRARASDPSPRACFPSLPCWQESEGDISIKDRPTPQHRAESKAEQEMEP